MGDKPMNQMASVDDARAIAEAVGVAKLVLQLGPVFTTDKKGMQGLFEFTYFNFYGIKIEILRVADKEDGYRYFVGIASIRDWLDLSDAGSNQLKGEAQKQHSSGSFLEYERKGYIHLDEINFLVKNSSTSRDCYGWRRGLVKDREYIIDAFLEHFVPHINAYLKGYPLKQDNAKIRLCQVENAVDRFCFNPSNFYRLGELVGVIPQEYYTDLLREIIIRFPEG